MLRAGTARACRQELAAAVVGEGLRPLQPAGLPPALGQLLDRCWAAEPSQRPSFVRIAEELRHMQVCQQYDCVAMSVYENFAVRTVIVNGQMVSDRLSWESIGSNMSMRLIRSLAGSTADNTRQ
jgi:Protein tyrosine and serine/threonine kinase